MEGYKYNVGDKVIMATGWPSYIQVMRDTFKVHPIAEVVAWCSHSTYEVRDYFWKRWGVCEAEIIRKVQPEKVLFI